jgi:long-chain acyl-CoA synthetase
MSLASVIDAALRRDGETPAVIFEGRDFGWPWMRSVADALGALLAEAGIAHDAPVGIVARNRPAFVAALLGMMRDGRSMAMIYALQSPEAIAADIAALQLSAVIADMADWSAEARAAAARTGALAIGLDSAAPVPAAPVAGSRHSPDMPHRGPFAEPGIELLTSGTTGKPKRLPMSYDLIERSMISESIVVTGPVSAAARVAPAHLYHPFGNISGLYGLVPNVAAGRTCMLKEKFSLEAWREIIRRYRPSNSGLPPAGVQMVLEAEVPVEELDCLEFISTGAAPLDRQVQWDFEERYGIPILTSYGATEFGGPVTLMTPELRRTFGREKFDSVGRAWAGAKLRVVDPDSFVEVPAGTVGLLEVNTPRLGTEWIRTSDLAMIDTDGFMFHRGRADCAINRGGFKILPETVVEALRKHPAIAAAAVAGLPDARLGQVPVAAIQLHPQAEAPSEAELIAHARRHLYRTHVPARFVIVDELPLTPSMKISLPGVLALFTESAGTGAG